MGLVWTEGWGSESDKAMKNEVQGPDDLVELRTMVRREDAETIRAMLNGKMEEGEQLVAEMVRRMCDPECAVEGDGSFFIPENMARGKWGAVVKGYDGVKGFLDNDTVDEIAVAEEMLVEDTPEMKDLHRQAMGRLWAGAN